MSDPIHLAVIARLSTLATSWLVFDWNSLSDAEQRAAAYLIESGLAQQRLTKTVRWSGGRQHQARLILSGPCMAEFEQVTNELANSLERIGPGWSVQPDQIELRLTAIGETAQAKLRRGTPADLAEFADVAVQPSVHIESAGLAEIDDAPAGRPKGRARISQVKRANATTIAYYMAHPNETPSAKQIGDSAEPKIDERIIRKCETWKLYQARQAQGTSRGNFDFIGENDEALEELQGTEGNRGRRSRHTLRK